MTLSRVGEQMLCRLENRRDCRLEVVVDSGLPDQLETEDLCWAHVLVEALQARLRPASASILRDGCKGNHPGSDDHGQGRVLEGDH
jgi:hypothetical protein